MPARATAALGTHINTPAAQRRRAEARALMHLGLIEYGARMGYTRLDQIPARLRAIANEIQAIGPALAQQVEQAA